MAFGIEAYIWLAAHNDERDTQAQKEEDDYTLYKQGLVYYQLYYDIFFKVFSERGLYTEEQKKAVLHKAREYFLSLLESYPDSQWVADAGDKLRKIDRSLQDLIK